MDRLPAPPRVPKLDPGFDPENLPEYRAFTQRVRICDAIRRNELLDAISGGRTRTPIYRMKRCKP